MMRAAATLFCLAALLPAQDAREIIRRACDNDRQSVALLRNYTYLHRQEEADLDGSGKVKSRQVRTWDITWQEGSPYRRLVKRNDQPLSPEEQRREDERLQWSLEQRRKETPEQRQRRIAEWQRRQDSQREPVKELPDAFDFRVVGEAPLNGADTWVIDATPRAGYKPRSSGAAFFPKVKARIWISKDDYQWVKVDMESMDTISLRGILVRIARGGHLVLEQVRINKEVWLPKLVSVRLSAKILFVKSLRRNIEMSFSDYKKFQAESRVISTEVK